MRANQEDQLKPVFRCLLSTVALLALFVPTLSAGEPAGSSSFSWITGEQPHPFLEIVYGIDWPRHKRLEAEFPSIGALELKGGYLYVDTLKNGIVSLGEGFIMGGWYNSDLGGGSGGTEGLSGSLGRFGLGYGQGYGYALKNAVVVPYFVSGVSWTKLSTDRPETLGETDNDILDRYEGTFRFGLSAESGIRPFDSETPLTHETLKFGVTFIL